jgi:hypothetical protein
MTMVTWDVRASGRKQSGAHQLARRVLAKVRPGSIVDFDLGAGGSPSVVLDAVPLVLQGLEARGLQAVRLDDLLHSPGYVGHCP